MPNAMTSGFTPMKALGRPFQIGTLYNYPQDVIISGTYLWDPDDVRRKVVRTRYRKPKVDIHSADNDEEKRCRLRMDDHLLMSVVANLVSDVNGASRYVEDHYGADHAGVCLHCRVRLRHEAVDPESMKRCEFLCHDRVLRQGTATHVVVGVTYGLESFCVARQLIEENEDRVDVEERLRGWFEHWCQCLLDERDSFDRRLDGVSCRTYSDIPLPLGSENLVDHYANCLNVLTAGDESAIPQIVWLCPLQQITSMAPRRHLVNEMGEETALQCYHLWNKLKGVEQYVENLIAQMTVKPTPLVLRDEVASFNQMLRNFQRLVDGRLRQVIGQVRSGTSDESTIENVIAIIKDSPFRPERLERLIRSKINTLGILQSVSSVANIRLIFDPVLIQQSPRSRVLVLRIPNLSQEHHQEVERMKLYVQRFQLIRWTESLSEDAPEASRIGHQILSETVRFSRFVADNLQTNDVEYLVLYDGQCQDSSLRYQWYGSSAVIFPEVDLPPVAQNLHVAENRSGKIRLQWQCGKIACFSHYVIEYREERHGQWKRIHSKQSRNYEFRNLKANVPHYFRLAIASALGIGTFTSQVGPEVVRAACDAPRSIKLRYASDTSLSFNWDDPAHDRSVSITGYEIDYWPEGNTKARRTLKSKERQFQIEKLKRGQKYHVRVTAVCGNLGPGAPSAPVLMQTDARPPRVACIVRDVSEHSTADSLANLKVYNLPIKERILGSTTRIRRCQFGISLNKFRRKTILVLGATGAGKSTLINGMINHILGVNFDDRFRFKLIREPPKTQAHSQTDHVTAYDIFHMRGTSIDYSLTIVDTPGFGDTRGLERDRMIIEQIRQYFQSADGIQELEAVCFLLQASLARLTPSQKYIYDSILSLFGKDIEDNIRLMVTFADNQEPPVLSAIQESSIPYPLMNGKPLHYRFNNSSLFAAKSSDAQANGFNKMFFDMGVCQRCGSPELSGHGLVRQLSRLPR